MRRYRNPPQPARASRRATPDGDALALAATLRDGGSDAVVAQRVLRSLMERCVAYPPEPGDIAEVVAAVVDTMHAHPRDKAVAAPGLSSLRMMLAEDNLTREAWRAMDRDAVVAVALATLPLREGNGINDVFFLGAFSVVAMMYMPGFDMQRRTAEVRDARAPPEVIEALLAAARPQLRDPEAVKFVCHNFCMLAQAAREREGLARFALDALREHPSSRNVAAKALGALQYCVDMNVDWRVDSSAGLAPSTVDEATGLAMAALRRFPEHAETQGAGLLCVQMQFRCLWCDDPARGYLPLQEFETRADEASDVAMAALRRLGTREQYPALSALQLFAAMSGFNDVAWSSVVRVCGAKEDRELLRRVAAHCAANLDGCCADIMRLLCTPCDGCGEPQRNMPKACARCRKARYCSPECQRAHWPKHKKSCAPKAAAPSTPGA